MARAKKKEENAANVGFEAKMFLRVNRLERRQVRANFTTVAKSSYHHFHSLALKSFVRSDEASLAMRAEDDTIVFDKDHLFSSLSAAATALTGRTANRWMEWKTRGGKTLDAVKRKTSVHAVSDPP